MNTILPRPVGGSGAASGGGTRFNLVSTAAMEPVNTLGGTYLVARLAARGRPYYVKRMVIQGPSGSIFLMYTGEPSEESFADGSQSGERDIADNIQPPYVETGLPLVGVWATAAGAPITGIALFRVEIEEVG